MELFAVDDEGKPSGEDLDHGSAGCLVLGELLAGVEAEHGDVQSISAVDDLGDDGSGLHRHFVSGTVNEGVRHGLIMHAARKRRWRRAQNDSSE